MPRKETPYSYFALMLYPDCDAHMHLLEIIKKNRIQFKEYVYILHDSDPIEDEELDTITDMNENNELNVKKKHIHLLYKYYTQKTENGMLQKLGGVVSKVIGIRDWLDYGMYLTHENPKALLAGKHIYPKENLVGTTFLIKQLNPLQNSIFVQFYSVVEGIYNTKHGTLIEYLQNIENLPNDEKDYLLSIVHSENRSITQIINDLRYNPEIKYILRRKDIENEEN